MLAGFVERAIVRIAQPCRACLPVVASKEREIDRTRQLETASRTKRDEAQSLPGEDLVKHCQEKA